MLLTVGESSVEEKNSIGVHVVFIDEGEWKFISCNNIYGEVLKVQSIQEKK